jgi:hypothetical protein
MANTELKLQGIVQTAQHAAEDPNSHINPETTEKLLVEESRRAGAAAYHFDPNATPQDKAQAAKAVCYVIPFHLLFPSILTSSRTGTPL